MVGDGKFYFLMDIKQIKDKVFNLNKLINKQKLLNIY